MFQGCFSYNKKGPCYIQETETLKEKKEADTQLAEQNKILKPICKAEQELESVMRRVRISRRILGVKPTQKFTKKTSKLERDSQGGIDQYRYQKYILKEKLLPFAKECEKDRPGTIVQEDNASLHAHHY